MNISRLMFFLLIVIIPLQACKSKHTRVSKKEKEVARMQEERKREAEKEYEKAVKRHMKMQSKDTRRRMKQSARTADRIRKGKPEPFYRRWFQKKPPKGSPARTPG